MDEGLSHGFKLDGREVDPESGAIVHGGRRTEISVLTTDFLMALAASPGDVIEVSSLLDQLCVPSIGDLDRCLDELQAALGDSREDPQLVRKVGDSGYQLLVPVHVDVPPVPTADQILG